MPSSTTRRTLIVSVMCCLALLVAVSGFTQARWAKLAPFPEPEEELYGVTVAGKMYVMGGYGGGKGRGVVYEYDPAADRWTKKKPMGRTVHHQAMLEFKGKIYVFGGFVQPATGGGWEPVDNAWEYDPVADMWKALAPLPMKRGSAVVGEVDGKMYLIAGSSTVEGAKQPGIQANGPAMGVTVTHMYDPVANVWQTRAPIGLPRNHAFAGVVNGKIYVIGGRVGHPFISVASNTDEVEEYDPATNTWSGLKTPMPTARSGGGWATHNGRIYVAGGEVFTPAFAGAFRAVEYYEPATNTWGRLPPMPMPRHGVAGTVIGNRFHLVSGMITTAAAGAGQDPKMEVHTSSHDAIDLPTQGTR